MPVSGSPSVMEAMPVALSVPAVPLVRPIIGTNTYRQVCTLCECLGTNVRLACILKRHECM